MVLFPGPRVTCTSITHNSTLMFIGSTHVEFLDSHIIHFPLFLQLVLQLCKSFPLFLPRLLVTAATKQHERWLDSRSCESEGGRMGAWRHSGSCGRSIHRTHLRCSLYSRPCRWKITPTLLLYFSSAAVSCSADSSLLLTS